MMSSLAYSLPADLTDNFNNMLLSGFKCSLKRIYTTFYSWPSTNGVLTRDLFFNTSPAAWL